MTQHPIGQYSASAPLSRTTKVILIDFDVCDSALSYYQSRLSKDELARLETIKFSDRRKQFITTRSLTRQILADCINIACDKICFKSNQYGKPLCSQPANAVHFNISHSHSRGLIAVNLDTILGVDIQHQRNQKNILKLATRFFAPDEITLLKQTPESELKNIFYHIWVRKEALLKAAGTGLSLGLSKYAVVADSLNTTQSDVKIDSSSYFINDLPAPEHYSAALALKTHNEQFSLTQWIHPE